MGKQIESTGPVVMVRGAGEQASGIGWVLTKVGYRVVMTEVDQPLMVRWPVSFGTAVAEGRWQVEGIWAQRITAPAESTELWRKGKIPVIVDPGLTRLQEFRPAVLIDAILAKRNIGTIRTMAGLVIGLGPGFCAGTDVDAVIETNRGHNLGRLIYCGAAEPNTGIPGEVHGHTTGRVLYAPVNGRFAASAEIGDEVKAGQALGRMTGPDGNLPVYATIDGVVRGLIRTGTEVGANVKIGDIDPRNCKELCWTISDKARAIGTAALMAIMENRVIPGNSSSCKPE